MLYDALAVIALWFVAAAIAVAFHHGHAIATRQWWFTAYLTVTAYLYFAYCWRRGQTLGMRTWRFGVIDATHGGPVSWRQTALRFGVALFSGMVGGLGYWWCLFDRESRTWHDRVSGTRLVHSERRR